MIYMCLVLYMYPGGKVDYLNIEGSFVRQRYNISTQREEWLIDATAFMTRTGLLDNLNPGMVWAESNLCLKLPEIK